MCLSGGRESEGETEGKGRREKIGREGERKRTRKLKREKGDTKSENKGENEEECRNRVCSKSDEVTSTPHVWDCLPSSLHTGCA